MPIPGHHLSDASSVRDLLVGAGVRPTTQRIALGQLLFGGAHRHVTAAGLHLDAAQGGLTVSMATVYNTLSQFVSANLLHEVLVDHERTYYDTNTEPHCHVFHQTSGELRDAPLPWIQPPEGVDGADVVGLDILFRLR